MNARWIKPAEYLDLNRLMEIVLKLRLRVASIEKAQNSKLGRHCGLHIPASFWTDANGCRKRKAGNAQLVRCRGRDG